MQQTPTGVSVVLCTCPQERAEGLAAFLIDNRLAACVNILPAVTSVYRWEGKICRDAESLLVIKCSADGFEALRSRLADEHPYDVPEIIALDVDRGHGPYLDWVIASGAASD